MSTWVSTALGAERVSNRGVVWNKIISDGGEFTPSASCHKVTHLCENLAEVCHHGDIDVFYALHGVRYVPRHTSGYASGTDGKT